MPEQIIESVKVLGQDLTDRRFTRLVAVRFLRRTYQPNGTCVYWWQCKCDCGNEIVVSSYNLTRGRTQSCKCLMREITSRRSLKHGESGSAKTKIYSVWLGMLSRCRHKERYAGRGISVCNRWLTYENFKADMEASYKPGLTIERKYNNGDYTPENCIWDTPKNQQNNKENNLRIEYGEENLTVTEWSERLGLSAACLRARLKFKWPIHDVLFRAKQIHNRKQYVEATLGL